MIPLIGWSPCPQAGGHLLPRHLTHALLLSAGVAVVGITVYRWHQSRRRNWVPGVAAVTQLFVHPIKSVPGIQVPDIDISPDGCSHRGIEDRFVCI